MLNQFKFASRIFIHTLLIFSILFCGFFITGEDCAAAAEQPDSKPIDIQGHWAEKLLMEWKNKGLISGYSDKAIRPDGRITRAEFVTIVNKAFGFSQKAAIDFKDVSKSDWFYNEVSTAKSIGYISGYQDGSFRGNGRITRQEAAVIVSNILHLKNTSKPSILLQFSDSANIADWSRDAMAAIVEHGYMGGYLDKTCRAGNQITRAETVAMLSHVVGALYNSPGSFDNAGKVQKLEGNVTVAASGITLKNMEIAGDLYLTEGIGDGNVILENVTVKGRTLLCGGGSDGITLISCSLGTFMIDKDNNNIRVVASGTTTVGELRLNSGVKLVEEKLTTAGFDRVVIGRAVPSNATVVLTGDFGTVNTEGSLTSLELQSGSIKELNLGQKVSIDIGKGNIEKLGVSKDASGAQINISKDGKLGTITLDAAAKITGSGSIDTANINANGTTFQQKPGTINLAKDITTVVNGETITQSTGPVIFGGFGGAGGSGGGPSTPTITITSIANFSITVGEQKAVTITVDQSDAAITAVSDKTNIATVSVSGKTLTVEGKSTGEAVITVTGKKSGYSDGTTTFKVTVTPIASITHIDDISIKVNEQKVVTVTVDPADAAITAVSDKTNIATVSVSGKTLTVEGKSAGEAVITVTANKQGYTAATATFKVTVTPKPIPPISIKSIDNFSIVAGAQKSVTVEVNPTDAAITAVSDKSNIASVSVTGNTINVEGKSAGTAVVTVTVSKQGYTSASATFSVTVTLQPIPTGTYTITKNNDYSASLKVVIQNLSNANYFHVYYIPENTTVNLAPVAIGSSLNTLPQIYKDPAKLEIRIYSDAEGKNLIAEFTLQGNNMSGTLVKK